MASRLFTSALGKDAHTFSRTAGSVTTRDVKRLYKEMMKAAMTVSNPKVRIIVYDSIRHEFKARQHMTDTFAVSEAMTRGCNDLESLRDQRVHPFLTVNEDGLVSAPRMNDPNAPALFYTPGPVLSVMWTVNFVIIGGFIFGYFYGWYLGLDPRGGLYEEDTLLEMHKGIPRTFEGKTLNWQYDRMSFLMSILSFSFLRIFC